MSQLKIKDGNNNWIDIPASGVGVPSGGSAGDVLVKSSAVDYATQWGFRGMKLLWTNPNPTSSFAAQTISLDLSGYDFVIIVSRGSTSVTNGYTNLQAVGADGFIVGSGASNQRRPFQTTINGITFNNHQVYQSYGNWSASSDNTQLIPYQIYGIKF